MAKPLAFLEDWKDCERCGLCETRNHIVFGNGATDTSIIFYGDKPGPEEDKNGNPMVGDTGVLFNNLIRKVGISREDVFVDNIVACWPTKPDGDKVRTRDPSKEEMAACLPRVWRTIYEIDPLAIVAFGANSLNALTGLNKKITAARGDMFFAHIPGVYKMVKSYPVFPTFHPAYALRRDRAEHTDDHTEWKPATIKNVIVKDLVDVRDFLIKLKLMYEGERNED